MQTSNYGVCVRGTNGQLEDDFYGILTDIIELEYPGMHAKKIVLFKCDWFDNTPNRGTKIDKQYGIVQVKESERYRNFDPFIFAQQADQVYYTPYPDGHHGWLAVIKTKARSMIKDILPNQVESDIAYQEVNEVQDLHVILNIDAHDYDDSLVDINGINEEVNISLLDQPDLDENSDSTYISTDNEYDSESEGQGDLNDTDST